MRKVLGFSLLALALASGSAIAGSNTGTMQVAVDIVNTCYIQSATLDFGQVPGVINTPVDGVGNIDIQCTPDTAWSISFDNGLNYSIVESNQRTLVQGADGVAYKLFTDASYSQEVMSLSNVITGVASETGGVQSVPVYGRLNAGQVVRSNWYGDSVGTTISF